MRSTSLRRGVQTMISEPLLKLQLSLQNTAARDGSGFRVEPADAPVDPRKPRAKVPGVSFVKAVCSPLPEPKLVCVSSSALKLLQPATPSKLSADESNAWLPLIAGTGPLEGLAHCYAGHQFGHFSGQLGDGAAILLGGVQKYEAQLKGAGLTAFSRTADGRKVLRSTLREFLASEHMHALGIPTTRAGGVAVSTTETVLRDKFYDGNAAHESVATVLRIAETFIRFGSFEIFKPTDATTGRAGPSNDLPSEVKEAQLRAMVTFVAETYYGLASEMPFEDKLQAFVQALVERTARLVAKWQAVGFCHGVLNSDNMSIVGDTLDYGPFGFMEHFDPGHICNTSDSSGRYAYAEQPEICKWNCHLLVTHLSPLCPPTLLAGLQSLVETTFDAVYAQEFAALVHAKLGLRHDDASPAVLDAFWHTLTETHADFTVVFRTLSRLSAADAASVDDVVNALTGVSHTFSQALRAAEPSVSPAQLVRLRELLATNPARAAQYGITAEVLEKLQEDVRAYAALVASDMTDTSYREAQATKWRLWVDSYAALLVTQGSDDAERQRAMNAVNPKFTLRNHVAQAAIDAAEGGDLTSVDHILGLLLRPFDDALACDDQLYARPLDPTAPPLMVSCSS
ncbi:selenoprotein O [Achlya hypogyna]|uniref:Selenoprotein O n=1 Tax=Achlya hypogyna TaxID=1202772 RepID=A0A1V9ZUI4_ACHHY|nr:selenoprotein O [Achlya hypogyna]